MLQRFWLLLWYIIFVRKNLCLRVLLNSEEIRNVWTHSSLCLFLLIRMCFCNEWLRHCVSTARLLDYQKALLIHAFLLIEHYRLLSKAKLFITTQCLQILELDCASCTHLSWVCTGVVETVFARALALGPCTLDCLTYRIKHFFVYRLSLLGLINNNKLGLWIWQAGNLGL